MIRILLCCFAFTATLVAAPKLTIEPQEVLLHEPVSVEIQGLTSKSKVKFIATMEDEKGRKWKSHATFLADDQGKINLSKQSPVEGTYRGVDAMGLFWSMHLDSAHNDTIAFRHAGVAPLHVSIAAQLEQGTLLRGKVVRKVSKSGVKKVSVNEEGVVGSLFLPEGEGPFPALLVLGGSSGGIPTDAYVAQFANQGYAALGLAYYRAPGVSDVLANIPLEYIEKAISWLKKQSSTKTDRLMVVGTSMGGSYALLAASHLSEIKGAVVFDGAGVVFQSLDPANKSPEPQSTFSYKDKPVPYIPINVPELKPETFKTPLFLRLFLSSYFEQGKEDLEAASIKVERIAGPVLLMGSLDDRLFASAYLLQHSYKRLHEHHFPFAYEFIAYKGAGHMLGLAGFPYSPTTCCCLEIRQNKMIYDVGGNPKDTAEAQVDSWNQTFAFLNKHIQETRPPVKLVACKEQLQP